MHKRFYVLFVLLFIAGKVLAGGPQVSLHGQKQIGMGLVGTSLTLDASSVFYNPGALAFNKQLYNITFGTSLVRSFVVYKPTQPSVYEARTKSPISTPFAFYASARLSDNLTAGLAVNTPYGNNLKWDKDWAGRFLIQDIMLECITIQPTLAYKVNSWLGVGAGLVYATGKVKLNKSIPLSSSTGEATFGVDGNANTLGYNVGIEIKPSNKLQIGIDYRSGLKMQLKNTPANFDVPSSMSTSFPSGNTVTATLPLAANIDFGASYQVNEKLLVAFSLNFVKWSAYDSLNFDFKNHTSQLKDIHSPREYSDEMIYRVGSQYVICPKITVRAGAYYDPSPCNPNYFTPETPSLDNTGLTCGFSYSPTKKVSVDFSFLYIQGKQKSLAYVPDNFTGTYKTRFFIPGIGLSINL